MTEKQIEERLRLHILNLCLAVIVKRDGDLTVCKRLLVAEVAKMMREQGAHV